MLPKADLQEIKRLYEPGQESLSTTGIACFAGGLVLMEGPVIHLQLGGWERQGSPGRAHKPLSERWHPVIPSEECPSLPEEYTQAWREEGGEVDRHGRHLIPYWRQFACAGVYLPFGINHSRTHGAKRTSDVGIYRIPPGKEAWPELYQWLTIERSSPEGAWALPGGHIDDKESAGEAGKREVEEETRLTLDGYAGEMIAEHLLAINEELGWNTWGELSLCIYHADQEYLHDQRPEARSDAVSVAWKTRTEMESIKMWKFHLQMVDWLIKKLQTGENPRDRIIRTE